MKFVSIKQGTYEYAGLSNENGILLIKDINLHFNTQFQTDLLSIIISDQIKQISEWYSKNSKEFIDSLKNYVIPLNEIEYTPLYRRPRKIWGIGLNYKDHAKDLAEISPTTEPASFMKPDTTIIGYNDIIKIPHQSQKTTGEAELGIIIGKKCKNVNQKDWLNVVAGFTSIIDMTAEDILRKNPRYLTLSKSFDTFFSFGPELITPSDIDDVQKLTVATVINNKIHAQNTVSNMIFPPDYLVSFHSHVMTLLPGDIISTGTPRAVALKDGDIVECHINGFKPLKNRVQDPKLIN